MTDRPPPFRDATPRNDISEDAPDRSARDLGAKPRARNYPASDRFDRGNRLVEDDALSSSVATERAQPWSNFNMLGRKALNTPGHGATTWPLRRRGRGPPRA